MKIIGKAEQKKIDLQIANLQQKVAELEKQLSASQAAQLKQEASAKQAQADAKAQLEAKANELAAANKALADAKAQAVAHGQSSSQAQESAQAQLDKKTKELSAAQAAEAKAKQDGEAALAAANKTLADVNKALADAKGQLDAKAKELAAAQAAVAKAKQDGDAALAAANKALADVKAQLDGKAKELDGKSAELSAAQVAANVAKSELTKVVADAQAKLDFLKGERDEYELRAQQIQLKHQDSAQEKEIILLQLAQAQNELAKWYSEADKNKKLFDKKNVEFNDILQEQRVVLFQLKQVQNELLSSFELNENLKKIQQLNRAKWARLQARLPQYIDFGTINISDVDGISHIPSITWTVGDYGDTDGEVTAFQFVTILQDGHPGIGLVKDGQPHAFVPKLLGTNKDHLTTFLGLGTTEFKQLTAAVSILDQLEAGQWKGFEFPAQFDLSFWRPSIQTLLAQLKLLPALLRYDEVRLKRELINPDYEHLWLEFRGLSLGAAQWKKFEIRLGAALVQHDGFSQYPKFEIPLINGKTKPFDSWYAESQDDSGAKLELRFALDKNVFDVAVWAKLGDADKALLLRLIYAMPDALKRLEKQKAAIHRPWATWIEFATGAVKVLEVNKAAAKLPAPETAQIEATGKTKATKALPAPAAQAKLPAQAKLTSTGAKAGKVISITARPMAKPASKPKAKPVVAKAPAKPAAKTTKAAAKPVPKPAAKTARKAKA